MRLIYLNARLIRLNASQSRGTMPAVQLGSKRFASKAAAWRWVKRFLDGADLGEVVAAEEMAWLEPLFRRHPTPGKLAGWDGRTVVVVRNPHNSRERAFALSLPRGCLRTIGARKCVFNSGDRPNTASSIQAREKADMAAWEAAAVEAMLGAGM